MMRLSLAAITFVFGLGSAASATDFGFDGYGYGGQRAGQIYVYDYEPGVRVRHYWHAPWQNRRYFPVTGTLPEVGRAEDLTAPRERHVPAETFYREWSTSSVFDEPATIYARSLRAPLPPQVADEPLDPKSPMMRRFEPQP